MGLVFIASQSLLVQTGYYRKKILSLGVMQAILHSGGCYVEMVGSDCLLSGMSDTRIPK